MTEKKRFDWDLNGIFDFSIDDYLSEDISLNEICELLNELNDENEQLKKEVSELKEAMKRMAIDMMSGGM